MKISWASGSERMPRMRRRVVCGRGVTIATFCPTRQLSRVDLPTLGRPPRATKPARWLSVPPMALVPLAADTVQGRARRGLLALLLAPAFADAELAPGDADASGEHLGMVRPARADQLVHRLGPETAIGDLLQLGLIVALGGRTADVVGEQRFDYALRGGQTAVGINRANHRLERRRQDRNLLAPAAFLLSLAQPQRAPDSDRLRLGC